MREMLDNTPNIPGTKIRTPFVCKDKVFSDVALVNVEMIKYIKIYCNLRVQEVESEVSVKLCERE